MELSDLLFALFGVAALLAGILPRVLERRPLSMPIAFLALGMLVFALPIGLPEIDPIARPELTQHLTEVCVIVALMGAGLKIDRPLAGRRWSSTWRLLAVAMPVTIAAMALLGWWWAGLVPASALLLGAALAPTDPVLAAEVQVGEPTDEEDSEDEVRFALTSEAGLNDGLALPFVYAAIAVVERRLGTRESAGRVAAGRRALQGRGRGGRRAGHRPSCSASSSSGRPATSCAWPGTRRASSPLPRRSSPTGWSRWRAGTASWRCSSRRAPSARRSARTSTTRCCTTSRSRSSGC
nr:hypothetical protein GCM10020092_028150 [Actinoplanes digitatis]